MMPDQCISTKSQDTSKQGIIYLLENEAFESPVIKIGKTKRSLDNRIKELNTGVPLPYTCYRASLVGDADKVEKLLHDVFHPAKRHWRGEFFEVDPWRVVLVLETYEIENLTESAPKPSKEDLESIDTTVQEKDKREIATFIRLGILVGEKLTLVNDPAIQCEVADGQTGVFYEDERYALTTLTTKVRSSYMRQGIRYWTYQDETLLERRDRIFGALSSP